MAGSLNQVQLIGHVGKDPEVRKSQNGASIVSFSIATSESWRDKNSGERKEKTEWHNVVVFNEALAKIAESYVRKGTQLFIEGKMRTRKWTDKSNVEKYSTEVVLEQYGGTLTMIGGKSDSGSGSSQNHNDDYDGRSSGDGNGGGGSAKSSQQQPKPRPGLDDEIPF